MFAGTPPNIPETGSTRVKLVSLRTDTTPGLTPTAPVPRVPVPVTVPVTGGGRRLPINKEEAFGLNQARNEYKTI